MDLADAYLFMGRFIAHATDGDLSDAEWEALVVSFAGHTRSLGYGIHGWEDALDRSRSTYDDLLATGGPAAVVAHFRACVEALRAWSREPGMLRAIQEDLRRVARADGVVDPMEEHFLHEVERRWAQLATAR